MITCIIFRCSVYRWIGMWIEVNMINLHIELIKKNNKKDYSSGMKEKTSWYIRIMRNFPQGDSYSPIGFCTLGNSVCKLLQEQDFRSVNHETQANRKSIGTKPVSIARKSQDPQRFFWDYSTGNSWHRSMLCSSKMCSDRVWTRNSGDYKKVVQRSAAWHNED